MSYGFNAGEVFKIAIQIEKNGTEFYEKSVKNIKETEIKALFIDLALQEIEHKRKFESLLAGLPPASTAPTVWDPDNEIDQYIKMMADDHIFVSSSDVKDRVDRLKDTMDALKLAIEFEKDSVLFFLGLEDAVTVEKDRELIKSLVKEEQQHLRRLTLELRKISKT
ncbi:Rubrerythrin [Syntrophobacter sp. SbD1]|nr:Rubrerythrin [Syntrophobacter sp. SbD1]